MPPPADGVRAVIPLLRPLFQGPLAPLGESLVHAPEPRAEATPMAALLGDPARLAVLLRRYAEHLRSDGPDLRAAASVWTLDYLDVLLPPVGAAATLLQHRFPVEAEGTALVFDAQGRVRAIHLRDTGAAMPGASTLVRYDLLLNRHLAPLFDALHALTRVPRKILWGNAARRFDGLLDEAGRLAPGAPAVAADRDVLLSRPAWTHGDRAVSVANPMFGTRRAVDIVVDGAPRTIHLHRQCCLNYRLPAEQHCGVCPLHPEFQGTRRTASDTPDDTLATLDP